MDPYARFCERTTPKWGLLLDGDAWREGNERK